MPTPNGAQSALEPETIEFYRGAIRVLERSGAPILLGGAYAFAQYTGIVRHTKDLDLFLRAIDLQAARDALAAEGFATDLTFPHWLAKARRGDDYVDLIFGSGNGVARVDDDWFKHSREGTAFGVPIRLIPPEEMIWSKAFVAERERFDGADIVHIVRCFGDRIDWGRLVARFGERWRVLAAHLVFFGFVYPGKRDLIPKPIWNELIGRLRDEHDAPPPGDEVCQGTLLSRQQYLVDLNDWAYEDARLLLANDPMTPDQIEIWTDAIGKDDSPERKEDAHEARGGR